MSKTVTVIVSIDSEHDIVIVTTQLIIFHYLIEYIYLAAIQNTLKASHSSPQHIQMRGKICLKRVWVNKRIVFTQLERNNYSEKRNEQDIF